MEGVIVPSRISTWGKVVAFSHSIFALPFALSMVVVATSYTTVTLLQLTLIVAALVSARTAAMAFNRIIDSKIDSENPRTSNREIPKGIISKSEVIILCVTSSLIFLYSSYLLGMHCLVLAPFVLGLLFFYSFTKRFTSSSHFWLGLALALAPGGVWYALTGRISFEPTPLMAAVLFWVAGFDIIYSCQDVEFDSKKGLFSVPSKIGIAFALKLSLMLHALSLSLLIWFGLLTERGTIYFIGTALFGAVMFSQHRLVSANDLSRVNQAFFTRNGAASFIFFVGTLLDWIII